MMINYRPWTIVPSLLVDQSVFSAVSIQVDSTFLPRRNEIKAQDDFVVEQPWGSSPPQAISQPVYIILSRQLVAQRQTVQPRAWLVN